MKIPLGGGAYLQPDDGPRDTRFHKRIVEVEPMPDTRNGNIIRLECGHIAMTFGKLEHAEGVVLCSHCQREAVHEN